MKKNKIILLVICILMLSGCTKQLKDNNNKVVTNDVTGQVMTENIICQPTDEESIKKYTNNKINIEKLPSCENFSPLNDYENPWTSIFVKPLAWLIIKIGNIVKNYGLSLIIACLIIRLALYPFTKKTAQQSEMMKKAQPELTKLENKYKNKTSQEDQTKKAQEMMMIYQKYNINPVGGCLLAIIQLPLLLAFYEAILRTPAIFEEKFLGLKLGMTPLVAIKGGEYIYIVLVLLILITTYLSFKKSMNDQANMGKQMKFTMYFMLVFIFYASLTMSSALGIYWITSSLFTIIQNKIVERKKNDNGKNNIRRKK